MSKLNAVQIKVCFCYHNLEARPNLLTPHQVCILQMLMFCDLQSKFFHYHSILHIIRFLQCEFEGARNPIIHQLAYLLSGSLLSWIRRKKGWALIYMYIQ